MSERDSDIEFDFFDEGETREATEAERPRRRGGRPPVRPPTGLTPLLRLIGLISFAILVVVLLVFWVNSCREDRRKDAYRDYIEKTTTLANDSQALGRNLNGVLTSRGQRPAQIEQRLEGLAQQQEQHGRPGPRARPARAAARTAPSRDRGVRLQAQRAPRHGPGVSPDRLVRECQHRRWPPGRTGAAVHRQRRRLGRPVQGPGGRRAGTAGRHRGRGSRLELPPERGHRHPALDERHLAAHSGSGTGGGTGCSPRGTGIVSVTALAGRQQLSPSETNTVESTKDLAFSVEIENSGCAQESSIPVPLTIPKSPTPIQKRQVLDLINPDETKTVVFSNIGTVPFAERRRSRSRSSRSRPRARPTTTPPSTRSSSRSVRRHARQDSAQECSTAGWPGRAPAIARSTASSSSGESATDGRP